MLCTLIYAMSTWAVSKFESMMVDVEMESNSTVVNASVEFTCS